MSIIATISIKCHNSWLLDKLFSVLHLYYEWVWAKYANLHHEFFTYIMNKHTLDMQIDVKEETSTRNL